MAFANGSRLIVIKQATPDHVASRFVCHHIVAEQYISLTPSGELIAEDYDDEGEFSVIRILPDDGALPFGVTGTLEDWDDFDSWPTEPEGRALFIEAARLSKKLRSSGDSQTRKAVGDQTPRGLEPRQGVVPAASAPTGGLPAGDSGSIVPAPQAVGGLEKLSRALQDKVPAAQSGDNNSSSDSTRVDLRVLPVVYEATGNRFRIFRDVVSLSSTITWPDWPILGPCTVQWCLTFMRDKSGSPTAWHSFWRNTGNIDDSSHLCMIHESMCRVLETACCYDQLDTANLASFELVCRQIQTTEERLKEKFTTGQDASVDLFLMSGSSSRASLCICPALSAWVATEAAKDTAVLKERRKAREERALLKPAGPKNKGPG